MVCWRVIFSDRQEYIDIHLGFRDMMRSNDNLGSILGHLKEHRIARPHSAR